MDVSAAINTKQLFRFTGPPEHWLTAVKYMTWGLEEKNLEAWKKIQTGDIFFIHSTGESKLFKTAKSGIIGIGVVGFHKSKKENFLWRYEYANKVNQWPLLVPLTELYLFSELPDPATWASPVPENDAQTSKLIEGLVSNRVPISEVKGFPQMGSFSTVKREVAEQILFKNRPLFMYSGRSERGQSFSESSDFLEVQKAEDTLRHTASLRFVNAINERIIVKPYSIVERDNDILARAEKVHFTVMQQLIDIFRQKGFQTMVNKQVDLFAHDEKRSFLLEVKSTENKNFRVQARKAISQLYEYDYFDITKYKQEQNLVFDANNQYKSLVLSREPKDSSYIDFMNSIDLGVAVVNNGEIRSVGADFGISSL